MFKRNDFIGIELAVPFADINNRFTNLGQLIGFTRSVDRWNFIIGFNFFKNTNDLYYKLNNATEYQSSDYSYTIEQVKIALEFLTKTYHPSKNVIKLYLGASCDFYVPQDVSIADVKPLITNTSNSIEIKKMGRSMVISPYLKIQKMFWWHNQEFSINLVGSYPVFTDDMTPIGDERINVYFPKPKNYFQIGIQYNLSPQFRFNPFKTKTL
jgi:hypothetical protein